MQHVETGRGLFADADRAQQWSPESRVRWSAVLSGAVTLLSIALLVFGLSFAIISLAVHPSASSMRGSGVALWVMAMVSTIIGALAGGWFAGRSIAGVPRAWGAANGFAAWGVAMVVAFGFQIFVLRGLATMAVLQTAGIDQSSATMPRQNDAEVQPQAQEPAGSLWQGRNLSVAAGWSWFGTWFVAAIAATMAGAAGSSEIRRRSRWQSPTSTSFREPPHPESESSRTPLTPSPSR